MSLKKPEFLIVNSEVKFKVLAIGKVHMNVVNKCKYLQTYFNIMDSENWNKTASSSEQGNNKMPEFFLIG